MHILIEKDLIWYTRNNDEKLLKHKIEFER